MSETQNPTSPLEELALLRNQIVQLERQLRELKGREQLARQEEARLHTVLMSMPVMVDAFDSDWNIVLWNRECERVSGYSAEEIVGNPKAVEQLYPDPAYRERMMREWRERGDDYRHWQWEMTAKDGSIKTVAWYNISKQVPIAPWKTWGIGVEITEQRKVEEALQESERQFRSVFENVPVGIYRTSPDGRTLMANPAFVRMLGYSSFEELARRNLEEVSLDVQYPRSLFKQRLEKDGRATGLESTWTKRDGSTLYALENARIVRDSRGRVLYYEGTVEDITERAQMEAELEEYRNHMAHTERLAALGTLSATVAHEMNQPLTVIRLTIQNCLAQLQDAHGVQEVVDDLKDCLEEVSTASSIVDRFKGFARHSARRKPGKTNLHAVAERVVRVWGDAARRRNISLVLNGLDRLGELRVDERDVEQVFFSLVENAVQAADGLRDHRLSITGAARRESVELRFADDCGGIAPEHVGRVFEPFFTTKNGDEGTGLGLCIVEQALSRVRGKIQVENRPGEGVTFVITLPCGDG